MVKGAHVSGLIIYRAHRHGVITRSMYAAINRTRHGVCHRRDLGGRCMLRGVWDDDPGVRPRSCLQGDGYIVGAIGCIVEGGIVDGDAVDVCSDTDSFITIEGRDGDVITVFESYDGDVVHVIIEGDAVIVRVVRCSCCS